VQAHKAAQVAVDCSTADAAKAMWHTDGVICVGECRQKEVCSVGVYLRPVPGCTDKLNTKNRPQDNSRMAIQKTSAPNKRKQIKTQVR